MNDFFYARLEAGFPSRKDVARLCGVTTRTIRNWENQKPPLAVDVLFQLLRRQLDWAGDDWKGWRFRESFLVT